MTRHARLAVSVVVAVLALTAAGCKGTGRELTVVFSAGTTDQQRVAAMQACTGSAPHSSPEPVPTPSSRAARSIGALIRFRIDAASDRDIAHLEECLQKQPGVKGFQDSAA